MSPEGEQRPTRTSFILQEFCDEFVDVPLLPPELVPHNAQGFAEPLPRGLCAHVLELVTQDKGLRELLETMVATGRTVVCGCWVERLVGPAVGPEPLRVPYPTWWRWRAEAVHQTLGLSMPLEEWSDRLKMICCEYSKFWWASICSDEDKARRADDAAARWAALPEEEKARRAETVWLGSWPQEHPVRGLPLQSQCGHNEERSNGRRS
jgi:hypothetical protein